MQIFFMGSCSVAPFFFFGVYSSNLFIQFNDAIAKFNLQIANTKPQKALILWRFLWFCFISLSSTKLTQFPKQKIPDYLGT